MALISGSEDKLIKLGRLNTFLTKLKELIAKDVGEEITQAEYDALPEDKKAKGTYWITDAD